MNQDAFSLALVSSLPVGTVLENPGGGTSEVVVSGPDRICYKRQNTRMCIQISLLFDVYERYRGRAVSSNELRELVPKVFDSKRSGHSCHCTFLFMAFQRIGLAGEIFGEGKRGSPFGIQVGDEAERPSFGGNPPSVKPTPKMKVPVAVLPQPAVSPPSASTTAQPAPVEVAKKPEAEHLKNLKLILEIGVVLVTLIGGIIALLLRNR